MPTPTCTKCRQPIPSEDINVAQDVAYCRTCNITYRLSELASTNDLAASINLHQPPAGAWYRSDGGGTVVGATNRSAGAAAGMAFFALFWNGIVSVFVVIAIVGTLHNLHVPLPAWFPNPNSNTNGGDGGMGAGMTMFLWLFLTPFIAIGLLVMSLFLSSVFGRTEVKIEGTRGRIFTGVGPLGWKRQFDASQVKDVRLYESRSNNGNPSYAVLIETREGKQLKLGSLLTNERRQFMLGALQGALRR